MLFVDCCVCVVCRLLVVGRRLPVLVWSLWFVVCCLLLVGCCVSCVGWRFGFVCVCSWSDGASSFVCSFVVFVFVNFCFWLLCVVCWLLIVMLLCCCVLFVVGCWLCCIVCGVSRLLVGV